MFSYTAAYFKLQSQSAIRVEISNKLPHLPGRNKKKAVKNNLANAKQSATNEWTDSETVNSQASSEAPLSKENSIAREGDKNVSDFDFGEIM